MDWSRFLRVLLASLGASFVGCAALIVLMNPYGNLPAILFSRHVITDQQQRFQYPGIVRTKAFDSAIFGTSSIRLLDPADLEPRLGGKFANLAMNDARAWEQYMLMKLFLRHTPSPRTMIIGFDSVWCRSDADVVRTSPRTFPDWMFDENPLNDWPNMFNFKALEISGRQVAARLGFQAPALPPSGFRVFTPPEDQYDLERARAHLYGLAPRIIPEPVVPTVELSDTEKAALRFPALDWLKEISSLTPPDTRMVFLFVPAHSRTLPVIGSRAAAEDAVCRQRIVAVAAARKATVIDFRYRSSLTDADDNFWDPLHFRLPVARTIADAIAAALLEGKTGDAAGTWMRIDADR